MQVCHVTTQFLLPVATSGEDFLEIMTVLTVSSNQPTCTNVTILNDDIVEGCEAFFVSFEVDPNFSGVAAIPRDADKSIVVIVDDLMDGKYPQNRSMCATLISWLEVTIWSI